MCKHILFNDFNPSDAEALKTFAALTHDRDGFGYIVRTKKGEIETGKSLDLASFYFDLSVRISKNDIQTLVVHHRTSTNGDGIEYAHPFLFSGNYLTHNGVVNVPGVHETQTKNDSEALLHHLIKSGYDTESIQGYFSCFILNESETVVLVDNTAPVYVSEDGRIYSSHRLGEGFTPVSLEKRTLCPRTGLVINREKIKVTVTSYGSNLSHLSLGSVIPDNSYYSPSQFEAPESDAVAYFYDALSGKEEDALFAAKSPDVLRALILYIADDLGMELLETEIDQLEGIFTA